MKILVAVLIKGGLKKEYSYFIPKQDIVVAAYTPALNELKPQ